ncbi:MAG: hypothetical protein R2795_05765 [Saprospiraceae bacterium]
MKILKLLKTKSKEFKVSEKRIYGAKILGMHLKSKEFSLLNRLFPQSDYDVRFVESFYGQHRFFLGAITSTLGIYLLLGSCYNWIIDADPLKVIILGTLISYTILTGLSLYVSEEKLREIDEGISLILAVFIERTKYNVKRNLCLSDKSAHRIKWNYIVFPLLFFVFIFPMGLEVTKAFKLEHLELIKHISSWYNDLEDEIVNSFKSNWALCSIQIIFIFLTYSTPRLTEERTLREAKFDSVRSYCTFFNLNIFIGFILAHLVPIILHDIPFTLENIVKYFRVTKHSSFLFLIGYIIAAILICVYFNQRRTKLNWRGKSDPSGYIIQMVMLTPYFVLIFIPLYLIPILFFLLIAMLFSWFFELSLRMNKLPSPTKQIAFFTGVTVLIVKFLYAP